MVKNVKEMVMLADSDFQARDTNDVFSPQVPLGMAFSGRSKVS